MWDHIVQMLAGMGHMQRMRAQDERVKQEKARARSIENLLPKTSTMMSEKSTRAAAAARDVYQPTVSRIVEPDLHWTSTPMADAITGCDSGSSSDSGSCGGGD